MSIMQHSTSSDIIIPFVLPTVPNDNSTMQSPENENQIIPLTTTAEEMVNKKSTRIILNAMLCSQ